MMKKKIAFLTGGYSGEAQVAYKSAVNIENNLDKLLFEVYTIDIRQDGWWYMRADRKEQPVDKNQFTIDVDGHQIHFDAVFIGIHGTPGEDGKLQGYFDMLGIPYTTCNATTSAITFNKRATVALAAMSGINVAKSLHFYASDNIQLDAIAAALTFPLFVKPANGGSSIGMSKVAEISELPAALQKAFAEDEQVLVEEFIAGREFTVGVFKHLGKVITLPLTEVVSHNYFFDFEAKYQGKSHETTPAEVDEDIANQIRLAAIKAYEVFNCKGIIRIDFIYNEQYAAPYLLEINTIPGQTDVSIVPQQVKAFGWNLTDFYSALLQECLVK